MSSTGFHILRSNDAGAPTLSGTAGALLDVLRNILQIGDSGAFWEEVFTGTNKAVFRSLVGDRYYLRVDDSNAQYANVRAFATMSDVDTGTGQFPDNTQQTNYCWHKSAAANGTARTYVAIATDRFVLLLINGGWSGSGQDLYCFGEIIKANASDANATVCKGYPGTTLGSSAFAPGAEISNGYTNFVSSYAAPSNNTGNMMPMAKSADGATAAAAGKYFGTQPSSNVRLAAYSEIQLIPCFVGSSVASSAGKLRGRLPHIFVTQVDQSDPGIAVGDTFSDESGATYQVAIPNGTSAANAAYTIVCIMTSDSERAGM